MAIDKSREIYIYVVQVWIQRRCKLTYTKDGHNTAQIC